MSGCATPPSCSHHAPKARRSIAPAPRFLATSPAQYPAGSGVGVSALLRQAHGFKGRCLVWVGECRTDDLSFPQLVDINLGDIHGCTARLPSARPARDAHDVLARVDVFADLSPKLVEALPPFGHQRWESLRSPESLRRVGCMGQVTELDIRVQAFCET